MSRVKVTNARRKQRVRLSLRRSGGAQMLLGVGAALERSGPSGPTVRRDHADDLAPTFVPPVV